MTYDDAVNVVGLALEGGTVSFLLGAGLSRPPPSNLRLAAEIAREIWDQCEIRGYGLGHHLREDLAGLAGALHGRGLLPDILQNLVPWGTLVSHPNEGHAAVADLLLLRILKCAITTNYDRLVEKQAESWNAVFRAAVTVQEANEANPHSPYLKLHGCLQKPVDTVWALAQIGEAPFAARIPEATHWIRANVLGGTLVVIGFWTDWDHLNSALQAEIGGIAPARLFVIDPRDKDSLLTGAPAIAAIAQQIQFHHTQSSGDHFLRDVRLRMGRRFVRDAIAQGVAAFAAEQGHAPPPELLETPLGSNEEFYAWRQDILGIPRDRPVYTKDPPVNAMLGKTHLDLRSLGGAATGDGYRLGGKQIRVIGVSGRSVPEAQNALAAEHPLVEADLVICAGAYASDLPPNLVGAADATIARPMPSAMWMDHLSGVAEVRSWGH